MIQIENLNENQVKILDHLWSLDTEEELILVEKIQGEVGEFYENWTIVI